MMFGFMTITAILETLIFMPELFVLLQLVLPPTLSFMVACLFNLVVLTASFICRLNLGPFLYRLITFVLSLAIAFITAGLSVGGFFTAVICIIIFSRVKTEMHTGRDIAIQLASAAIFLNIPLAIFFFNTNYKSMAFFGNIAVCISTAASIIVLVIKQVDESRRFGRNTMDISTNQRRNNRIFGGIMLVVLLLAGSVGQVTTIYRFVFSVIGKFFALIAGLLAPGKVDMPPPGQQLEEFLDKTGAKDPSLFEKIFMMLLNVLSAVLLIAAIIFLIYHIIKFIVRLIIKLVRWLRSGEHYVETVSKYGHTDEKESLLNRNFKKMANRFKNIAAGLLSREIPYNNLPDDISKIRRLFKYFIDSVRPAGVKVTDASTAQEICRDAGGISPVPPQVSALLAECYDKARYDYTAPSKEQLGQLEEKLLKK